VGGNEGDEEPSTCGEQWEERYKTFKGTTGVLKYDYAEEEKYR